MIFAEDHIPQIKALAKKDPLVKKLWEYYLNSQADGAKAIRITLNAELIALNADLTQKNVDYDFTLNRIGEISTVLKKLPKEENTEAPKNKKKDAGEKKSVFDLEADKKRE